MFEQQRVQAYETAIAAIRQYIERPTDVNAIEVEAAWQALRKLEALAAWRQPCVTDDFRVDLPGMAAAEQASSNADR